MRRLALAPLLAALAFPAAAAGKEGAMFSPALSSLTPGHRTTVTLVVGPVIHDGRRVLSAPRDGKRPVVVLRSADGRREARFRGAPLFEHVSTVDMTIPSRRRWRVFVRVGHRRYPV